MTFLESLEGLYESAYISKCVLVARSVEDALDWGDALKDLSYTVVFMTQRHPNHPSWPLFQQHGNVVLVTTIDVLLSLDDNEWTMQLMREPWNALVGVDVPSYYKDTLMHRIQQSHQCGFGVSVFPDPRFHILWYLH